MTTSFLSHLRLSKRKGDSRWERKIDAGLKAGRTRGRVVWDIEIETGKKEDTLSKQELHFQQLVPDGGRGGEGQGGRANWSTGLPPSPSMKPAARRLPQAPCVRASAFEQRERTGGSFSCDAFATAGAGRCHEAARL